MVNTITAIIADDEKNLRDYMRQQLGAAWPELDIVAEAENGLQAVELYVLHKPDICFLDIKMPGKTGLQVAEEIQKLALKPCQLVFATAYDEYAIQAFENAAVDYLLKPITLDRLTLTVERLQQSLVREPQADALSELLQQLQGHKPEPTTLKWLRASDKNEVHLIAVEDVLYFQSADKYTSVFTENKEYLVRTALKELEQQLDDNLFWRIHRGTIVQVSHIGVVTKDELGHMSVSLKVSEAKLPVSRSFQSLFKSS